LWDTAGQERFKTLTKVFYKKAEGFGLVFDLCDKKSFESINGWL